MLLPVLAVLVDPRTMVTTALLLALMSGGLFSVWLFLRSEMLLLSSSLSVALSVSVSMSVSTSCCPFSCPCPPLLPLEQPFSPLLTKQQPRLCNDVSCLPGVCVLGRKLTPARGKRSPQASYVRETSTACRPIGTEMPRVVRRWFRN